MEKKLSQSIYDSYLERGVELSGKQIKSKLDDLIEYWADSVIPEMVKENIL
jgi:hypothetical protein